MENNTEKRKWSPDETQEFYKGLLEKALESIPATGAVMVLGPMFKLRTPEENFALFEKAQAKLKEEGVETFNQLPFVDYMIGNAPFEYGKKFEIFYKSLINSGKITACYLLPDWEKSEGTIQEIEYCRQAGVPVYNL